MSATIGHECIQFALGKRGFINGKPYADILWEQQTFIRIFQLILFTKPTENLLVLLFKYVSIYMMEILKRTTGPEDVSIRFFLKKFRIPWRSV